MIQLLPGRRSRLASGRRDPLIELERRRRMLDATVGQPSRTDAVFRAFFGDPAVIPAGDRDEPVQHRARRPRLR
jgi:hypothetical protein